MVESRLPRPDPGLDALQLCHGCCPEFPRRHIPPPPPRASAKAILVAGIAANLALLGYYKYANFFVENINTLFGSGLILETIILPLAISFFTFQQIAYLVDAYRGETHEYSFLHYALFVIFFPRNYSGTPRPEISLRLLEARLRR